ncbi:protein kinase [Streptomyces sp. ISL-94]|uniref:serine/threonine-protein kinase n=1 Tax=Streptomyces sp. ISL-94 TaxID=2819190 RepID=UPI001BE69E1A|nr:serine/threonine-protein kinase [Streptomyces sp. ISL-94]MBT2479341.1 protein kinase [Streptomyces sp. ISL-94]
MEPLGTGDPVRLGPYRLLGVLGAGGMGKVYFGRDADGRTAAVKVLLPELAHDPNLAQRFVREAHTAQAVTSPGVARVLNARSEDGNRPWIATEFLSGPTLDDAVQRFGPFDPDGIRALAASLAATLRDIHAAGLVHRDLKPANIVLTSAGPRVIDFGIARPEHGLTLTTTGQVPVTPGYGAPEQVLGRRVGPAADVFSLGAVLAYAATGRRAFDGTHVAAVQYEVVHGEPQLRGVPDALRHLIAPCLAKDPAYRPSTDQIAAAFAPPRGANRVWRTGPLAQDIARRGTEAERQATLLVQNPGTGPSRRRLLRASLSAGGVLAAGGGAGAWWLLRDEPRAPLVPGLASGAEPLPLSAAQSGKPPKPLWGPLPVAAQAVDGVATTPLSLRDVVMFASKDGGLAARLTRTGQEKWRLPDIAPEAGLLALAEPLFAAADVNGALRVHEASTAKLQWSLPGAEASRILTADTDYLYVVTRGGRLRAVDIKRQTIRWTVPLPATAVAGAGPRAAVGGSTLVVFGAEGTVRAFYKEFGDQTWEIEGQATSAIDPLVVEVKTPGDISYTVFLGGRTLTARTMVGGDELWKAAASGEPRHGAGGWGAPMRDGTNLICANGTTLAAVTTDGKELPARGRAHRGPLPHTPLVRQGQTLWAVEGEGRGVSAYSATDGKRLWTWAGGSSGPWAMSGAGNRVFLVNDGRLTAMPTVG